MFRELVTPGPETRYIFFAGKGGVGKSTVSAATAVWLADRGFRTLLVSTDLQRSLSDIFENNIGCRMASIPGAPLLAAMETDPRELVRENWHRLAGTVQEVFGSSEVLELMSREVTPCMMEMAGFYKLMELYTETAGDYDALVFDTAPGGRALIEIFLPFTMTRRYGAGDPFAEFRTGDKGEIITMIAGQERRTRETMDLIANPGRTIFIYVMWPESLPIAEAERAVEELSAHRITVPGIVVNQVLPPEEVRRAGTPYFRKRLKMQQEHLARIREIFRGKEIAAVQLWPEEVKGLSRLRQIASCLYGGDGGE
ncbi:MAG: ArsA family ATPase [Bacillota bacterium]